MPRAAVPAGAGPRRGGDSSRGELIAGLVWSTLIFVVVASNVFSGSLWLRLISVVALPLLVNPIRAVRLLVRRDRGRPGAPSDEVAGCSAVA